MTFIFFKALLFPQIWNSYPKGFCFSPSFPFFFLMGEGLNEQGRQ